MEGFIKYTKIENPYEKNFSKIDYFSIPLKTLSKNASSDTTKSPEFLFAGFSNSGSFSTSVSTTTTLDYSNLNLAQALRQSADYAKSKAKSGTTHRCAHYVSNALEASGIKLSKRENGWNYDKITALLGMHDVTGESTFKKGDIAVTKTNDGSGHVAICNRDGAGINDKDAWTSDFNSRAHPYSENKIKYAHVFRALQGIKLELPKLLQYTIILPKDNIEIDIPKFSVLDDVLVSRAKAAAETLSSSNLQNSSTGFLWSNSGSYTPSTSASNLGGTSSNTSTAEFIKKQEGGFKGSRYKDAGGQSIGYGFYGDTYWKGNSITKELADLVLDKIISDLEKILSKYSVWNKLNQNLKTALHSYMYNVGSGKFLKGTKMGDALASGDLQKIHDAISITTSQGKRVEGLVKRREQEKQLFKS